MSRIAILATAAIVLGAFSTAQASSLGRPCTSAPAGQWLSLDALKAKVEAQGYKVQKAKLEKACGEIYVRDKDGNRAELFLDPATGDIITKQ